MKKKSKHNKRTRKLSLLHKFKNLLTIIDFKAHKKFFLLVVLLLVCLFYYLNNSGYVEEVSQNFCSEIKSVEFAKKHTVHIKSGDGTGTGFYIAEDLIVTNNHVVEGDKEVEIGLPDGLLVSGTVMGWNNKTDIAVIRTTAKSKDFFQWRNGKINDGENVFTVGFPLSDKAYFKGDATVTKGVVSALRKGLSNTYLQTDGVIQPGNSGGPFVDKCGKVIAVSDLSVKADERSERVYYGIYKDDAKIAVNNIVNNPTYTIPEGTLPSFIEADPLNTVKAYYEFINSGETLGAYQYTFTASRQKKLDTKTWLQAFDGVKKITVKNLEKTSSQPIKIKASLVVERHDGLNNSLQEEVESEWTLKYNAGNLLLDDLDSKVLSTKAVYLKSFISDIKEIKANYEKIYSKILGRDFAPYPTSLVNEVKNLIYLNKQDIATLESKITSSTPFDSDDLDKFTRVDERHTRILEIQKTFDSIDWDNYLRALYRY